MGFNVGETIGIGAAGSAINGVLGGISSFFQNRSAAREAQKARRFAAREAEKARQYNTQMIESQRQYDSPQAYMSRLASAGVNPALAYTGSQSQSPVLSSGIPSAPMASMVGPDMSNAGLLNNAVSAAQIGLLKANERKVNAEAGIAESYEKFADQLNKGAVKMQNVEITVGESAAKLNDAQKQVAYKTVKVLDQKINVLKETVPKLRAETANIKADTFGKQLDNILSSMTLEYRALLAKCQVEYTEANIKYLKAQTVRTLAMLAPEINNLVSDTTYKNALVDSEVFNREHMAASAELKDAFAGLVVSQTEQVQVNTDLDRTFGAWERGMGLVEGLINSASNAAVAIGKKPIPLKTGSKTTTLKGRGIKETYTTNYYK
ncbi:DNA pilot protein [Sigmofec virus UA08Rod_4527]|uniref:DNA pilot protein n=1 Tax=Sigmofec virus UA08Rod_4527 TaxID=2929403 RepID=A0A976N2G7_9VIRU|nr:DNA pilot protein [Sigmofec virus UA08Rod_4527]